MRSIQGEGKDDIVRLSKQMVQLQVVVQKPENIAVSNPWQSGSEKDNNRKKGKTIESREESSKLQEE